MVVIVVVSEMQQRQHYFNSLSIAADVDFRHTRRNGKQLVAKSHMKYQKGNSLETPKMKPNEIYLNEFFTQLLRDLSELQ